MTTRRRASLGVDPLFLQFGTVLIAGIAVVVIAVLTSGIVEHSSRRATNDSNAALLASDIRAEIDNVLLLRLEDAIVVTTPGSGRGRISLDNAIAAHDAIERAARKAENLHVLIGSDVTLQIFGAVGEARDALTAYLHEPTPETFADLQLRATALRTLTGFEIPAITTEAQSYQTRLRDATNLARVAIIIAAAVSAFVVGIATVVTSRRLSSALRAAEDEKGRLVDTTRNMQRRNDQFAALYQVGSEVGESLNMSYVVQTTAREARKLVGADIVAVRRMVNGVLSFAGTERDEAIDVDRLADVSLGTGIVGRAAKRGKTISIDAGAAAQMAEGERIDGIESGIVVPLIVGARVVGTLECWSRTPHCFDTDDERILEMMATQVATAIVSADSHEQSQRDAHTDALTSLPNRRQLNEDVHGVLVEATLNDVPHAIAMIDIDHFKRFNDDYGHRVGDITLQRVAEVLKSSIREEDRVYRFGGEEFLIIFADVDGETALKLAERARVSVERAPLTGDSMQPVGPVTISVGVALFPAHGHDVEALIDIADRAMYASKELGRNRVTLAGSEPDHLARAA